MSEYINRKEALHKISINALAPIAEVYKAVEAVPVEDVQPVKHGKWMFTDLMRRIGLRLFETQILSVPMKWIMPIAIAINAQLQSSVGGMRVCTRMVKHELHRKTMHYAVWQS